MFLSQPTFSLYKSLFTTIVTTIFKVCYQRFALNVAINNCPKDVSNLAARDGSIVLIFETGPVPPKGKGAQTDGQKETRKTSNAKCGMDRSVERQSNLNFN